MFLVVAIEVEKGGQVKMVENGRKWQAIDFHGYLVGNGFPRIIRHSPTTVSISFPHRFGHIQFILFIIYSFPPLHNYSIY